MDIGMGLTGAEALRVQAFIRSYRACFAVKIESWRVTKANQSGFNWRKITQYFDVLTN